MTTTALTVKDDDVDHTALVVASRNKLQAVADSLQSWLPQNLPRQEPCTSLDDCVGYRSRCSFQCVWTKTTTPKEEFDHTRTLDDSRSYSSSRSTESSTVVTLSGAMSTAFSSHSHEVEEEDATLAATEMHYAVRRQNQVLVIDSFPVANRRIHRAMMLFRNYINEGDSDSQNHHSLRPHRFSHLKQNLTSVSWATSWKDIEQEEKNDSNDNLCVNDVIGHADDEDDDNDVHTDCLLTLHYDEAIQHPDEWIEQASQMCVAMNSGSGDGRHRRRQPPLVTQLSGRARKCVYRASAAAASATASTTPLNHESTFESCPIRDSVWLWRQHCPDTATAKWNVSLSRPKRNANGDTVQLSSTLSRVVYEKPEDAFSHPNANVMCRALEWMLSRIEYIQRERSTSIGMEQGVDTSHVNHDATNASDETESHHSNNDLRLLELYCGCGAHTMALLQTNLLTHIVAVELDKRLVEACRRNHQLNTAHATTATTAASTTSTNTKAATATTMTQPPHSTLEIVSMDAGLWAARQVASSSRAAVHFDVLLVDPPKQGLDEHVCRMATTTNSSKECNSSNGDGHSNHLEFEHILYISCGRDALVRDLDRLSTEFEVVDCLLLDLFPQTEAVESLVHLQRRTRGPGPP